MLSYGENIVAEGVNTEPIDKAENQRRPKVLAVDDRNENLLAIAAVLSDLDAELLTASSGSAAISLALRHEFAVVLLDVNMPVMDGFETASLLRQNDSTRHVPIIFVTGVAREEHLIFEGYRSGAVDFLMTPIDEEILRSKVRVFLELFRKSRALELLEELRESRRVLEEEVEVRRRTEVELAAQTHKLEAAYKELQRRAEALELSNIELRQFAFVASHDLQTPLRAIGGFLQLLTDNYRDVVDSRGQDWIDRSIRGCERMRELILALLDYSRVDARPKPFEEVDLGAVLDDVLMVLERPMRESSATLAKGELPVVRGDRLQLGQMLQNLLENALKYRGAEPPKVSVAAERAADGWRVHVRDNGIGIDAKHHKSIFEIFRRLHTTSSYPGTGIGLAICRRIAERHRGTIDVDSCPGSGSTFTFNIPE